tara:strand:+ start:2908 stop:3132 length:225 start_codon:yes stop_codon:yes gene_type:complete
MTEYRILEMLKDIKGLLTNRKDNDKWLDMNQASNYTNLSKSTLRRYVKDNRLNASKKLGKVLFKKSELESFLNG